MDFRETESALNRKVSQLASQHCPESIHDTDPNALLQYMCYDRELLLPVVTSAVKSAAA